MENILLLLALGFIGLLVILDVAMAVSLVRLGDERQQMIVGRASTYTLLGTVGATLFKIVERIVSMEPLAVNPFSTLGTMAIVYFAFLFYFKRKYGG